MTAFLYGREGVISSAHHRYALAAAMLLLTLAWVGALVVAGFRKRRLRRHGAEAASFGTIPEGFLLATVVALLAVLTWELAYAHGILTGDITTTNKLGRHLAATIPHFKASVLLIVLVALAAFMLPSGLFALTAARRGRSLWRAALRAGRWSALIAAPLLIGGFFYFRSFSWSSCCFCGPKLRWQIGLARLTEIHHDQTILLSSLAIALGLVFIAAFFAARRLWHDGIKDVDVRRWTPLASALFFAAAFLLIAISPYRRENLAPLAMQTQPVGLFALPSLDLIPPTAVLPRKLAPGPVLTADASASFQLDGMPIPFGFARSSHETLPRSLKRWLGESEADTIADRSAERDHGRLALVADTRLPTATVRKLLWALFTTKRRRVDVVYCVTSTEDRPLLGPVSRRHCTGLPIELCTADQNSNAAAQTPPTRLAALPQDTWDAAAAALRQIAAGAPHETIRLNID